MTDESPKPKTFATHVLHGQRFQGHAVPVNVLSELGAYRDLVVAVARGLFFQENRGRQRVPKNFEEGFQLVLRAIDEGSAVLPLERVGLAEGAPTQLPLPAVGNATADLFERARDLISDAIKAAGAETALPPAFPHDALPLFNSFGTTLVEGETIELRGSGGRKVTTPAQAFQLHTQRKKLASAGVWSVTVGECSALGLATYGDPIEEPVPDAAHAVIDFRPHADQIRKYSQLLARAAVCQYTATAPV